jgi:hypothetical protein
MLDSAMFLSLTVPMYVSACMFPRRYTLTRAFAVYMHERCVVGCSGSDSKLVFGLPLFLSAPESTPEVVIAEVVVAAPRPIPPVGSFLRAAGLGGHAFSLRPALQII